jgi:hypothetical protein
VKDVFFLKMGAVCLSEMLVSTCKSTWHHSSEDQHRQCASGILFEVLGFTGHDRDSILRSSHPRTFSSDPLISFWQGGIKGFVGPRHFSSLGPFGDLKSIVGTTVYSRLSGLTVGEGMYVWEPSH